MFSFKSISIQGPRPKDLKIQRNESGVPKVKAGCLLSGLWGSGYAHAVDRSTQMLMMRILGQGRLCELLSDNEESLAIDRFFRRANWSNNMDEQLSMLDPESIKLCQSYCDGVNAGFATKKISALKFAGYQAEPWKVSDIILISRMASYLSLAQSQAEIEKFFVEMVQSGVETDLLAELFPVDVDHFDRDIVEKVHLEERLVPHEVLWNLALPRMMASNNWVVSGAKTVSGEALMANDPHLEVNRLPNVWCEQIIDWGENYLLGMGMPGMPGILVGRSKYVSWGATYTFMDTIDSWVERCQNGMYEKDGNWYGFNKRVETVKRKSHLDEEVVFYENDHGVLEGNPYESGYYLATRWIAADSGAKSLQASLQMPLVKTAERAMQVLGDIESGWNWVIADQQDNIAYQMSGMMPKRKDGWNGFTPAPGWDSSFDWKGVVPQSELPSSYNPKSGFIVTANQNMNHLGSANPINMPMGSYRADRISDVLASSDQHSVETTKALQMDVYSKQAKMFLDVLLPLLEREAKASKNSHDDEGESSKRLAGRKLGLAYDVLSQWDMTYGFESIGAPVFERFYAELRRVVFGEQAYSLGDAVVDHLSNETGVFIDFYQNFDRVLLNEDSAWYRDITQKNAFLEAYYRVEDALGLDSADKLPKWKAVNSVNFVNILFQGKLPKFLGFDADSIPLLGGRATPHQGQVYRSGGRDTSFAPSIRIVADMSEDCLHSSVAGGPSDNRMSPYYMSSLEDWLNGVYAISRP